MFSLQLNLNHKIPHQLWTFYKNSVILNSNLCPTFPVVFRFKFSYTCHKSYPFQNSLILLSEYYSMQPANYVAPFYTVFSLFLSPSSSQFQTIFQHPNIWHFLTFLCQSKISRSLRTAGRFISSTYEVF